MSTYFISKFVYARFRLLNGGCRGVSAKSVRSVSLSKLDQKGKSLIAFKHMLADPRDGTGRDKTTHIPKNLKTRLRQDVGFD